MPIIVHSVRYFENLCVIRPATDTHVILDPGDGLDAAGPNIWYVPDPAFDDDPVYIGHPSLSEDGTTILFNASVDGAGTVWNVYTVGFDPTALTIVPNSLKRITLASGATPNPIKLNGGAHFSEDESEIIFTSTLTPAGNSMLFTIPSTATDVDVGTLLPLNPTPGNDYLPMPVDDDRIVFVSDLGPASLCGGPTVPGASADLDLFVIDLDGTNLTNVTDNDAADEMLLIGDEVSWFCGLKPNLTACSKTQRIFDTEALWLTWQSTALIPDDLLQRFNLPTGAMDMYQAHWLNLSVYVNAHPHLLAPWEELWNDVNILQTGSPSLSVPPFPGLGDSLLLEEWLRASAPIRDKLYVLPSIMGPEGIPGS
ncbi:MAG: hypothetical protein GY946_21435 [bacterium]|nr:hypothetical protein [bacterium]